MSRATNSFSDRISHHRCYCAKTISDLTLRMMWTLLGPWMDLVDLMAMLHWSSGHVATYSMIKPSLDSRLVAYFVWVLVEALDRCMLMRANCVHRMLKSCGANMANAISDLDLRCDGFVIDVSWTSLRNLQRCICAFPSSERLKSGFSMRLCRRMF